MLSLITGILWGKIGDSTVTSLAEGEAYLALEADYEMVASCFADHIDDIAGILRFGGSTGGDPNT